MTDGIFESVSQGSGGAEDAENRRIEEIIDELHRRCQLYEKESGIGKADGYSIVTEQRVAEQFGAESNLWLPISEVFQLGVPGPSGNENDTYVSNDVIFKVNNLLNVRGSVIKLMEKVLWHNRLFVETAYSFHAFTGFPGSSIMPVFKQNLIKNALPATPIEIATYMAALGFLKVEEGRYVNSIYEVWDLLPRNVLKDTDGDIYVIDAEIKLRTSDI